MQTLVRTKPHDPVALSLNLIDQADLETTNCLICQSSSSYIIHTFKQLNVVICRECGLVYLNPRLKELIMRTAYRSENYFLRNINAGYEDYSFQENSLRITFRRFLEQLKKQGMTSDRLLEVGSGYGYFLDEAKHFFSYRAGIELSPEAGYHAERLSGAHVHVGDIGSLPPEFNNFSLIVLINVIEHIYSPIEFLFLIKKLLKDDGRIVIATPDIGSFWYKIMKKRWPSFKVPEHVAFYSEKTLKLLLQKTGFADIQRLPFSHAFPFGLIAHKLGISVPVKFGQRSVWLPKTMTALSAKNFNE